MRATSWRVLFHEETLFPSNLQWRDAKGRTPLMYACNHAELYETAKTLLELGANVNAVRPRKYQAANS